MASRNQTPLKPRGLGGVPFAAHLALGIHDKVPLTAVLHVGAGLEWPEWVAALPLVLATSHFSYLGSPSHCPLG